MSQIKGLALFLAQFVQDVPPYNMLENITIWAREMGFRGVHDEATNPRILGIAGEQ